MCGVKCYRVNESNTYYSKVQIYFKILKDLSICNVYVNSDESRSPLRTNCTSDKEELTTQGLYSVVFSLSNLAFSQLE